MSRTFEAYFFARESQDEEIDEQEKKKNMRPSPDHKKNAVKDTIEIFCDFQKNS